MGILLQDVRYGLRMLRRSPGFTVVAVLTLALGIGANTAIFSLVNSVLLTKLPFRNPNKLMIVRDPVRSGDEGYGVSVPDFEDYRAQQHTFQDLSLWVAQSVNLTGTERPDRVIGSFVSANFFHLLEVQPIKGRTFVTGEDRPGSNHVVVVSHGAWQDRFGSDPNFIGKQLTLNGEIYTVIGILPASFHYTLADSDVWITISHYPDYIEHDRAAKNQLMIGRIKDESTRSQAAADLDVIARSLAANYPQDAGVRIALTGFQEAVTESARPALLVLLGAVGLVLLIACANVANLLLSRGAGRSRELAMRAALGATRTRIVRQLLTETCLVGLLGGAGSLLIATWALRALLKLSPRSLPVEVNTSLNWQILTFATLASLLTGVLCGCIPALRLSTIGLAQLAAGGRTTTDPQRHWLRSAIVVGQVALSIVVLIGAGLLVKSFSQLLRSNPGFNPTNVLTMEYRLPASKYHTAESRWNFHRQITEQVSHVPGVVGAAIIQGLPFSGNGGSTNFTLPGMTVASGQEPDAIGNLVTPGYFALMGISVLRGRTFADSDTSESLPVAVISQSMAEKYWPQQDPVGKEILFPHATIAAGVEARPWRAMVVGVVADVKQYKARDEHQDYIYVPYAQMPGNFGTLVVKTAVEPMSLSSAVREAVWRVDRDQPVWKIRTMEWLLDRNVAQDRFVTALMSCFGVLALGLTILGTYGVIAYSVVQRTREIGVRMALGATPANVLKLVFGEGCRIVVIGTATGLIGALATTRLLGRLLYGVHPNDPLTFALVLAAMLGAALIASYIPARRATKVDPMVGLRYE
ncbi:MAG: ABC transporter permease [Acidobacteriia bacterium]|nr:ABC transporter permease [Terriglobia bacterium]